MLIQIIINAFIIGSWAMFFGNAYSDIPYTYYNARPSVLLAIFDFSLSVHFCSAIR